MMARWLTLCLLLAFGSAEAGDNTTLCFPARQAEGMLQQLETGRVVQEEAAACRSWQIQHLEVDQARAATCQVTILRLDNAVKERDQALSVARQDLKTCQAAVDAAGGSWWDRMKTRATWAGVGASALAVLILIL